MSAAILRYEAQALEPGARAGATLERGRGAAVVAFARRGRATVLAQLFQRTPCRVMFPRGEDGDPPLAVLITTSGGLAGGDEIRLSLRAEAGAVATITTQAAEKIYRSLGPVTDVAVELAVEDGAFLEYLPQETILFDGARLERRSVVMLAPTARLLAAELLVFGRAAHGERLGRGRVDDGWEVRRRDRLVWMDRLVLDGDIRARLDTPFAFAGAEAMATAFYAGADAATHLARARALAEGGASQASASLVNGLLLARFLAPRAAAVRADVARWLAGMRQAVAGLPARLPRAWHV